MTAKTLYDKIWDAHLVHEAKGESSVVYIDRHLVHEVTSPQAFEGLRLAGRQVRCPERTLAVADHNALGGALEAAVLVEEAQVEEEDPLADDVEAEVAGLDHAGVDRADRNLIGVRSSHGHRPSVRRRCVGQ